MKLDIFTLFPEAFDWYLQQRHVNNVLGTGSAVRILDMRATTPLKGGRVDDSPYGGGPGMVLRVDVVDAALQAAYGEPRNRPRIALLTPGGRPLGDGLAVELANEDHLSLICGRYEGFDQRIHEYLCDDEISIGPYVVAGGELPAMVLADTVIRKLPDALGDRESATEESFSDALDGAPEYPHYTRPPDYNGWVVPDILLSGDHARIKEWRRTRSRERGR